MNATYQLRSWNFFRDKRCLQHKKEHYYSWTHKLLFTMQLFKITFDLLTGYTTHSSHWLNWNYVVCSCFLNFWLFLFLFGLFFWAQPSDQTNQSQFCYCCLFAACLLLFAVVVCSCCLLLLQLFIWSIVQNSKVHTMYVTALLVNSSTFLASETFFSLEESMWPPTNTKQHKMKIKKSQLSHKVLH